MSTNFSYIELFQLCMDHGAGCSRFFVALTQLVLVFQNMYKISSSSRNTTTCSHLPILTCMQKPNHVCQFLINLHWIIIDMCVGTTWFMYITRNVALFVVPVIWEKSWLYPTNDLGLSPVLLIQNKSGFALFISCSKLILWKLLKNSLLTALPT